MSSYNHTEDPLEEAMERLVLAMTGQADPVATSLANRVLKSQIGSNPEEEAAVDEC